MSRRARPQTLWSSASFFPAHISFTIRCHRSHSVFRLASNTSFLDTVLIFKVGILRSRKATVVLLTSCGRRKKKKQVERCPLVGTQVGKGKWQSCRLEIPAALCARALYALPGPPAAAPDREGRPRTEGAELGLAGAQDRVPQAEPGPGREERDGPGEGPPCDHAVRHQSQRLDPHPCLRVHGLSWPTQAMTYRHSRTKALVRGVQTGFTHSCLLKCSSFGIPGGSLREPVWGAGGRGWGAPTGHLHRGCRAFPPLRPQQYSELD